MGDRTIEATGSILFEDLNNGLRAIVQLGTYQKTGMVFKKITGSKDEITGFIYRSSQVPMKPTEFGPNQKLPEKPDKVKDCKQKLVTIGGSWLETITFDDKDFWDIDEFTPDR